MGPNCEKQVTFVEAQTGEHAMTLVTDYIERKYGITEFCIDDYDVVRPLPDGRIIEGRYRVQSY
jgi:hypothetical protein